MNSNITKTKKIKTEKINYKYKSLKRMTICIAALCVVDRIRLGIVFCADRLRSSQMHRFEGNVPKYKAIPDKAILLGAGDVELIDEILEDEFIQSCSQFTTREIASLVHRRIKEIVQRKIEDEILTKHGLSKETYITKNRQLSDMLIENIEDEKEDLIQSIDIEFILAGCDPDGKPKLYTIKEGGYYPHVTQNIAIIGSGTTISNLELSREYQNAQLGLSEAILKVYKAKKSAEMDFYVGRVTDIGIIYPIQSTPPGIFIAKVEIFEEGLIDLLDGELNKIKTQELRGMGKVSQKLNNIFYQPAQIEPEEMPAVEEVTPISEPSGK